MSVTVTSPVGQVDVRDAIVAQVEFYLSPENLAHDSYLVSQMEPETKFVPISVLAQFKKLRALSDSVEVIADALRQSRLLELDATGQRVKPKPRPTRNTIILREISSDASPDAVAALFTGEGAPKALEVRAEVGDNWFAVFADEQTALDALQWLRSRSFNGQPVKARMKSESTGLRSYFVSQTPGMPPRQPVAFVPQGFYYPMPPGAVPMGAPWDPSGMLMPVDALPPGAIAVPVPVGPNVVLNGVANEIGAQRVGVDPNAAGPSSAQANVVVQNVNIDKSSGSNNNNNSAGNDAAYNANNNVVNNKNNNNNGNAPYGNNNNRGQNFDNRRGRPAGGDKGDGRRQGGAGGSGGARNSATGQRGNNSGNTNNVASNANNNNNSGRRDGGSVVVSGGSAGKGANNTGKRGSSGKSNGGNAANAGARDKAEPELNMAQFPPLADGAPASAGSNSAGSGAAGASGSSNSGAAAVSRTGGYGSKNVARYSPDQLAKIVAGIPVSDKPPEALARFESTAALSTSPMTAESPLSAFLVARGAAAQSKQLPSPANGETKAVWGPGAKEAIAAASSKRPPQPVAAKATAASPKKEAPAKGGNKTGGGKNNKDSAKDDERKDRKDGGGRKERKGESAPRGDRQQKDDGRRKEDAKEERKERKEDQAPATATTTTSTSVTPAAAPAATEEKTSPNKQQATTSAASAATAAAPSPTTPPGAKTWAQIAQRK